MRRFRIFWIALLGLGLSLIDVSEQVFSNIPFWEFVRPYSTPIIQAILGFAVLVLLFEQSYNIYVYYQVTHTKEHGIGWSDADLKDLKKIHEIGLESIGDVCSYDQLCALYDHNPKSVRKIVDNANRNEIIGYIILLPITSHGIRLIESNSFHLFDGKLNKFWRANLPAGKPYYLSALVGKTKPARYVATKTVHVFCENKGVTSLYARAATRSGLNSLKSNDFVPVHGGKPAKGVLFVRHENDHPSIFNAEINAS